MIPTKEPPYVGGVFECTINAMNGHSSVILCNERGDSIYWFDELNGKDIYLVSPVLAKDRASLRHWKDAIKWKRYNPDARISDDKENILVPRRYVKRVCKRLGLRLFTKSAVLTPEQIQKRREAMQNLNSMKAVR